MSVIEVTGWSMMMAGNNRSEIASESFETKYVPGNRRILCKKESRELKDSNKDGDTEGEEE